MRIKDTAVRLRRQHMLLSAVPAAPTDIPPFLFFCRFLALIAPLTLLHALGIGVHLILQALLLHLGLRFQLLIEHPFLAAAAGSSSPSAYAAGSG